jgi:hypothetical protein
VGERDRGRERERERERIKDIKGAQAANESLKVFKDTRGKKS